MLAAILLCLSPIATDGDTLRCGSSTVRVRLFGVEAADKTPTDAKARVRLQALSAGGLKCEPKGTSYSRIVAQCRNSAGVDVGAQLLSERVVVEWCRYSKNAYGSCPSAKKSSASAK